ncbi:oxidoreductase [Thioclava dalianensis]|uniref:Oxidoreductase n=1 Tax=Thioclava dalianensis TaxID=1185766 RepID=A0A074TEV2_9RHOB|nr:SDR family oxidoreductase [Thioclava dalianensis]KEP70236.1 oxidoreductase [Thioclava dalianensis]SFM82596.1 7-alpha-hydroxysteroid dehydrogenase [Thioclava dalianensis]
MSLSISGKTAIVTGAAHGIGLAIARHFLDRGAQVMFADIDEEKLASELGDTAKSEGPARYFAGDLCQKLAVKNLLSATVDAFDRIDVLVNTARGFAPCDPLDPSTEVLDQMLDQNMRASLRISQMTARRMIKQSEDEGRTEGEIGSIINVSTLASCRTQPELMAYSIACAAQDQAIRSLAVALAPQRIRVNGVSFGSVMSRSLQSALKENDDWREAICEGTPLGRIAPPSELAETVQYLASSGSSFVTGQIVTIDGGRSLLDRVQVPAF